MNTPKIRFKGYADAWEQRKLRDVLQFQNGFNGGREVYGEGTAFISVMDILNNQFITYDCIRGKATVSDDELERFSVRYGDVLFQRSSENVEDAGTSNVYIDRNNTAIFGGFVIRGKQIAPYSPKFMKYLLDTKPVRNQITKKAQGAQHVNVSQETLQDVQISLPSQEEQTAIENCLYTLDNLITLHQRKCDRLNAVKKYMLQKMFPQNGAKVPEIRFKGFTGAWEQRKFSETFDGLQNNTLSRAEMNYENGEVKNIHYGDILVKFGSYIDVSKEELPYVSSSKIAEKYNGSFLNDGDIIIADTAEDSTVGKCSEIVGSVGLKLLSGLHTIPCRPKQKHAAKFLGYYMNSPSYHQQLIPLMQGIKVTSISKSALNNTDMIVPKSLEEQGLIGAYFSNLDNLITLNQRKCDSLKELKKFMLQNMFP